MDAEVRADHGPLAGALDGAYQFGVPFSEPVAGQYDPVANALAAAAWEEKKRGVELRGAALDTSLTVITAHFSGVSRQGYHASILDGPVFHGPMRQGIPSTIPVVSWMTRKRGRSLHHAVNQYSAGSTGRTYCGREIGSRQQEFANMQTDEPHRMSDDWDICRQCRVSRRELVEAPFALRCIPWRFNVLVVGIDCKLCLEQLRLAEAKVIPDTRDAAAHIFARERADGFRRSACHTCTP